MFRNFKYARSVVAALATAALTTHAMACNGLASNSPGLDILLRFLEGLFR